MKNIHLVNKKHKPKTKLMSATCIVLSVEISKSMLFKQFYYKVEPCHCSLLLLICLARQKVRRW